MFSKDDQAQLIEIARQAISYGLLHHQPRKFRPQDYPTTLQVNRATFVTLEIQQQLRGCIGTLNAHQSIVEDISHNAYAAAFSDHRFAPVSGQEAKLLDIHLSILNPAHIIPCNNEAELLASLRPGLDGIIVTEQTQRATFLPSVWESLADPKDFIEHLKQKAGLSVGYWSDSIQFERYTVETIDSMV